MSTEKSSQVLNLSAEDVRRLREDIRRWYGNISVDELVQNKALTEEIKELEQLLSQVEVPA